MNYFLYFTISAALILILLMIVYFSKKKLNTLENKIYSILMILTLISAVVEVSMLATNNLMDTMPFINTLAAKGYLLVIEAWVFVLCFYTFYVTTKKYKSKEKQKKMLGILFVIYLICAIVTWMLPIYYYFPEGGAHYTYTYGPSTKMVFVTGTIYIMICMYYILTTKGALFTKKNIPIYVYMALAIFISFFQQAVPSATLVSYVQIFITILMYFTLENPDLKVIEELNRNKSIIEKSSQGTSNFMFNLTTEARQYINAITKISNRALQVNDKKLYEEALKKIIAKTKEVDIKVNTIMDVSAIDVKNIKITNKEYNIKQVLDEIRMQAEGKINKNINFVVNISQNLPDKLYGDKIRLKQVISSILANAIKNTEEGFIVLEANTIIKYDVCRIILSVEDSGKGIDLETVNNILSSNDDINSSEIEKEDTLNMSLKMIKKVMKMLGGSLLVSSEESKGTKVTIVLDQMIADDINQEFEAKISDYSKKLGIQKVLIVDDDLKELNDIQKYCNYQGIESVGTMDGKDCLSRIRVGQNYDVIILDDEMEGTNAINILQKLRENKKFKAPVIIMLEEKKISISKHYLADGFADFIDKSRLDAEIKRVVNKYLK